MTTSGEIYPRLAAAEMVVRGRLWRERDPRAAMCRLWPMIPPADLDHLTTLAERLRLEGAAKLADDLALEVAALQRRVRGLQAVLARHGITLMLEPVLRPAGDDQEHVA